MLLALTINKLPQLKKLKLYGLPSKGIQFLCEQGLTKPGTLNHLTLVGTTDLNEDSADYLIQIIQHNTNLISLSFCSWTENNNWMERYQASELGKALEKNQNLISFKLEGTDIDDQRIIAGIIANNSCLKILDLSNNGFGYRNTDDIFDALSQNTTLLSLDLCSNHMLFPESLNTKFNLINFEILKHPGALDSQGMYSYYNDYDLENKISLANYRMISEMLHENKQKPIIQKYLLLQQLVKQESSLNTDLFNLIMLPMIICSYESFELQSMGEKIRNSRERKILEIAPTPVLTLDALPIPELTPDPLPPPAPAPVVINNPPESNCPSFLLELGASLILTSGAIIGTVALLATLGFISISTAGIAILLSTAGLAVGLGIYGLYKSNCKQDKEPVDENSPMLMA